MDWLTFITTNVSRIPFERLLFPRPDPVKELQKLASAETTVAPPPATPPGEVVAPPEPKPPAPQQPTPEGEKVGRDELEYFSLYFLQKNLQGLEIHLPRKGIGRKQCDCLDKHSADVDLYGGENVKYSNDPAFYRQVAAWGFTLNSLQPDRGLELGTMKPEDYQRFADEAREFRLRVYADRSDLAQKLIAQMGVKEFKGWVASLEEPSKQPAKTVSLEEAKRLAANKAAEKVEKLWHSPGKK